MSTSNLLKSYLINCLLNCFRACVASFFRLYYFLEICAFKKYWCDISPEASYAPSVIYFIFRYFILCSYVCFRQIRL